MLTAMSNPAGPDWFVTKSQKDLPEDQQTRFKVRGLIGSEVIDVSFVEEDGWLKMTGRGVDGCIRAGLIGWERFLDRDGKEVVFLPGEWRVNASRIPPFDLGEIAREIWRLTKITEEERKN